MRLLHHFISIHFSYFNNSNNQHHELAIFGIIPLNYAFVFGRKVKMERN
jgi:hypothetical protein